MTTNTPDQPVEQVQVSCGACRESIPVADALTPEASEYAVHFCGVECYHRWLAASQTIGDDTF